MVSLSLSQFLALFAWFPLAVLLFMVLLIARFYQRFSGRRTYFQLYPIPIALFGLSLVRYASTDQIINDDLANLSMIVAGLMLIGLLGNLYWCMVIRKQIEE